MKPALSHVLREKISDGPHETPKFVDNGIPFLSVDNIIDGQIDMSSCRFISECEHLRYARKTVPIMGDVLLTKAASVGKVAYVETEIVFNVWSPIAIMKPRKDVLDGRYLAWVLRSAPTQHELLLASTSNTQQNISMDDLSSIRIPLRPIAEQRVIADYLDREIGQIDALITKKRRMIELCRERLTADIESTLNLSAVPIEPIKRFVSKVGSGSTPRGGSDVYVAEGVTFLRSQNIRNGRIDLSDAVFISTEDDALLSGTRVCENDVLLNITGGSIGRTAIAAASDLPANVSQHVCILRPSDGIDSVILQAALDSRNVQDQIQLVQVGGNREGLNFEQIRTLQVIIPVGSAADGVRHSIEQIRTQNQQVKERLTRQLALLSERRWALITAAVTGELEIPGVAA